MSSYRVVNLETGQEATIQARTPEHAAELVFGRQVVRSGAKRDLLGKVYWQNGDDPVSMLRVYSLVAERES